MLAMKTNLHTETQDFVLQIPLLGLAQVDTVMIVLAYGYKIL